LNSRYLAEIRRFFWTLFNLCPRLSKIDRGIGGGIKVRIPVSTGGIGVSG